MACNYSITSGFMSRRQRYTKFLPQREQLPPRGTVRAARTRFPRLPGKLMNALAIPTYHLAGSGTRFASLLTFVSISFLFLQTVTQLRSFLCHEVSRSSFRNRWTTGFPNNYEDSRGRREEYDGNEHLISFTIMLLFESSKPSHISNGEQQPRGTNVIYTLSTTA